jgi:hypothetical protein
VFPKSTFRVPQHTDARITQIEYEVTAASLAGTDPSKRYGTIVTVPVTPLSRGFVNITSSSTRDLPLVNPNQLSHPTDREVAVQAFKRARSFFHTDAMRPIIVREYMPGANVTSDADILKYIMNTGYQNWHASCTCRMGRREDGMAVVDSRARVIGVQGLRVWMRVRLRCCRRAIRRVWFVSCLCWRFECEIADCCVCWADVLAERIADDILRGK